MSLKYLISLFFIVILCFSCKSESSKKADTISEKTTYVRELLSKEVFAEKLKADSEAQLIDVRTPEEYAEGHLEGATNINIYDDDFEEQLKKLDKEKAVFVYCKKGGRSGKAAAKLQSLEFKKVFDLEGGYTAWAASN